MDSTPNPTVPPQTDSSNLAPSQMDSNLILNEISSVIDQSDRQAAADIESESAAKSASEAGAETVYENQLVQVRLGLASALFVALRAKHAPSAAHCLRVALGSSSWGLNLDLDDGQRDELEVAALLHDIGKIGVPDRILTKPARLNREEVATIDRHRKIGQQILLSCCASQNVLSIVEYAPAWWDGSRSGFDCRGDDLPQGARIISIIDAYDSMTNDQVYRRAMSRERAVAELFACAGTQFDPDLVEQFCDLLTSDRVKLSAQLSRRWLNDLDPEQSNAFWAWNTLTTSRVPAATNIGALFHQKLLDSMHDGVVFVDTNMHVLLWNRAAEDLTGLSAASVLHQHWSPTLMHLRDEHGAVLTPETCPITRTLSTRTQTLQRLTIRGSSGKRLSIDMHMVPVIASDGIMQGATLLLHDASPQITMEQRIETLHIRATRDPLTNVANRAEFDSAHIEFVATHGKRGQPCALLICDIDHFKSVNDTYGHQVGDDVLVAFASLLQRSAQPGDLVARYGGEEFVILCADCDNATITQRAEKIRRELEDTPHVQLDNRPITASFGVTEIQAGDTPETMLRRADRALLRAKESGRNRVVQLGTGIPGNVPTERRNLFRRWLQPTPSNHLLDETLVTAVPLAVTMEKLRGFISDHHAEIVATEDSKLRLQITKSSPTSRRAADRPIAFLVSLQFLEKQLQQGSCLAGNSRTMIRVSIQLANYRDRRRDNADERARQLFASLKSYFMAQAFEGPMEASGSTDNPTLFRRLRSLLQLRGHNK